MYKVPTSEEDESFVRERLGHDWPQLIGNIRAALKDSDAYEKGECPMVVALSGAGAVLRQIVSPEIMKYISDNPPNDVERNMLLRIYAIRLTLMSELFSTERAGESGTLGELADELRAIASGDNPRLVAKLPNTRKRRTNAYRRAELQLEALMWEQYLRAHEISIADAQNAVSSAFGERWDTIAAWKDEVVRELGDLRYNKRMDQGRRGGWGWRPDDFEEHWEMLKRAGQKYRDEQRRAKTEPRTR